MELLSKKTLQILYGFIFVVIVLVVVIQRKILENENDMSSVVLCEVNIVDIG